MNSARANLFLPINTISDNLFHSLVPFEYQQLNFQLFDCVKGEWRE